MPLVDYSDSEASEPEPDSAQEKRAQPSEKGAKPSFGTVSASDLPPLPESFHDLYASHARISGHDDPSLHGGRQRQTPHVEGNWPTHVYIEWLPSVGDAAHLVDILNGINAEHGANVQRGQKLHSLIKSDLGAPLPLHISLSRPVTLRLEQHGLFLDVLTSKITEHGLSRFDLRFDSLGWVSNEEGSRWFLVLSIEQPPSENLGKLLQSANETVNRFGQAALYDIDQQQPKSSEQFTDFATPQEPYRKSSRADAAESSRHCHISIAWTLEKPIDPGKRHSELVVAGFEGFALRVSSIKAKIGNTIHTLHLGSSKTTFHSFVGN